MDEDIKLPSIEDCLKEDYRKIILSISAIMPDGNCLRLVVYEGENPEEMIKNFKENWYKITKEDPKKFDHFIIKDKCPKCGGEMHAKIDKKKCFIWCINHPNCNYQTCEEDKVRERIYEKFGLKHTWVHKTGGTVIFSNKPINNKK